MSTKKIYDFKNLYKDKMEKRLVDYLDSVITEYSDEDLTNMVKAQVALSSKAIENVAMMIIEGGYVSSRGNFIPFSPTDLLTIQQALKMALDLRGDLMFRPTGAEQATKLMEALNKFETKGANSTNKDGTGLAEEPPPLQAVDEKHFAEEFNSTIKEAVKEPEMVYPVALPVKSKS